MSAYFDVCMYLWTQNRWLTWVFLSILKMQLIIIVNNIHHFVVVNYHR